LGVCEDGPIMIVHPEAIKYGHVTEAALERIFLQHLLQNQPVEELIVHPPSSRPILRSVKRPAGKPQFRK
jgi:(2Fe-2S) ferredoxin